MDTENDNNIEQNQDGIEQVQGDSIQSASEKYQSSLSEADGIIEIINRTASKELNILKRIEKALIEGGNAAPKDRKQIKTVATKSKVVMPELISVIDKSTKPKLVKVLENKREKQANQTKETQKKQVERTKTKKTKVAKKQQTKAIKQQAKKERSETKKTDVVVVESKQIEKVDKTEVTPIKSVVEQAVKQEKEKKQKADIPTGKTERKRNAKGHYIKDGEESEDQVKTPSGFFGKLLNAFERTGKGAEKLGEQSDLKDGAGKLAGGVYYGAIQEVAGTAGRVMGGVTNSLKSMSEYREKHGGIRNRAKTLVKAFRNQSLKKSLKQVFTSKEQLELQREAIDSAEKNQQLTTKALEKQIEVTAEQTEKVSDKLDTLDKSLEKLDKPSGGGSGGGGMMFLGGGGLFKKAGGFLKKGGKGALKLGGMALGALGLGTVAMKAKSAPNVQSMAEISKKNGVSKTIAKGASSVSSLGAKAAAGVAARIGLRAIPIIGTLAMAGYDAFSGFNDAEMQRKTFNLKDGESASLGQKSASALGNVLDLGGLVSGTARFFGADMETSDVVKKVYGYFGGNNEDITKKAFNLEDGEDATLGQKASTFAANTLAYTPIGWGAKALGFDTADVSSGIHSVLSGDLYREKKQDYKDNKAATYGNKENEDSGIGQDLSTMAANWVDVGGLVSGTARMFGAGDDFDTKSMARGIYKFFGGNVDENEIKKIKDKKESQEKTEAKKAETKAFFNDRMRNSGSNAPIRSVYSPEDSRIALAEVLNDPWSMFTVPSISSHESMDAKESRAKQLEKERKLNPKGEAEKTESKVLKVLTDIKDSFNKMAENNKAKNTSDNPDMSGKIALEFEEQYLENVSRDLK